MLSPSRRINTTDAKNSGTTRRVSIIYTKFDRESGHDPVYDADHLGMDVNHTSGDHTWLDGESVDLERFRGDLGTWDDDACHITMNEWYTSGHWNQDTSDTREYHSGFRYSNAGDRKHTDGKQLCQLIIKEWSCLADRVKTATSPFSHYDHQAAGCRQVLTCSARVMEDGALVNGLTVNLKQSAYGGGVSADIDLALQEDLLVSIAFTEGTSPRSEDDDAVTCKAESLGLFLSHHNLPAGHHGLWLLSAILGGHSQAGRPYQAGLHALGHGVVGHGYGRGGIYQAPRTLVKEAAVTGGIKSTFTIQRAGGFTSLAELAGHGVVVCPSDKVEEEDGVMR